MLEALFKRYCFFVIFSINIIFCIDEHDLANKDYIANYHPICSRTCVDFYLKEKTPYIGLHWMVSHNLLISNKMSLINHSNNDMYFHNLSGFDLNITNKENYKLIFSFDLNKSYYYENQNYGWHQVSLIYLTKIKKSNFQIILDSIYDNDWDYKKINYIYGINLYHSVFFNIGLIQTLSDNNFEGFLTLNFNI